METTLPRCRYLPPEMFSGEPAARNKPPACQQSCGRSVHDASLDTFQRQLSTGRKNVNCAIDLAFPATIHSIDQPDAHSSSRRWSRHHPRERREQPQSDRIVSAPEGCLTSQRVTSPSSSPAPADIGVTRTVDAYIEPLGVSTRSVPAKPVGSSVARPPVIKPVTKLSPREAGSVPTEVVTVSPTSGRMLRPEDIRPESRPGSGFQNTVLRKPSRQTVGKDAGSPSPATLFLHRERQSQRSSPARKSLKKHMPDHGHLFRASPFDSHAARLDFRSSSPLSSGAATPVVPSPHHTRPMGSASPPTSPTKSKKQRTRRNFLGMSHHTTWELTGLIVSIIIVAAVMTGLVIIRNHTVQKLGGAEGAKSSKAEPSPTSGVGPPRVAVDPAGVQTMEQSTASVVLDWQENSSSRGTT
ncbi:uncharacterized protein LOC144118745 [Amblyomma americanum]